MQRIGKIALLGCFLVCTASAQYYFDASSYAKPSEVEQILSDCAVVWDRARRLNEGEDGDDDQYCVLRNAVIKLVRALSVLNGRVRSLQSHCSLEVLYYIHDMIKQMCLELYRQADNINSELKRDDSLILLLFDLLDSEFERTYYYLDVT